MFSPNKTTINKPQKNDTFVSTSSDGDWQTELGEGKLMIDVAETAKEVIVVCPMAGVEPDKLAVHIHNDLITIRGVRKSPVEKFSNAKILYQECYWGRFSRTLVLPVEVKSDSAKAEYKNGVLKIRIAKRIGEKKIPIVIVED